MKPLQLEQIRCVPLLILAILFTLFSCSSSDDDETGENSIPKVIQNIVSQEILDELEAKGMKIHLGQNPPFIEGTFHVSPFELAVPYGDDDAFRPGQVVSPYDYTFYNQVKNDVKMSFRGLRVDHKADGVGAIILGDGDYFSVFLEGKGVDQGVENTRLDVISGRISEEGIHDFQNGFLLTSKDSEKEKEGTVRLMPLGKSRIFFDGDGMSERLASGGAAIFLKKQAKMDGDIPSFSTGVVVE